MAGNFWHSSHYEQWLLEKADVLRGRADDLKVYSEDDYQKVIIFFSNLIHQIATNHHVQVQGKTTRMQVIATACVYFKRFYVRRSFKDVDPFLMAPACIFLASKAEEHGVLSTKSLLHAMIPSCSTLIGGMDWPTLSPFLESLKKIGPLSAQGEMNSRVAMLQEAEFILLEILDCCLVVYQPYRPLQQLITDLKDVREAERSSSSSAAAAAISSSSSALFASLPLEQLEADTWRICNDSMRTDASLLYAPHLIAIGCIQLAALWMGKEEAMSAWFAELVVDFEKVFEIVQILLAFYKHAASLSDKETVKTLLEKLPHGSATAQQSMSDSASSTPAVTSTSSSGYM